MYLDAPNFKFALHLVWFLLGFFRGMGNLHTTAIESLKQKTVYCLFRCECFDPFHAIIVDFQKKDSLYRLMFSAFLYVETVNVIDYL